MSKGGGWEKRISGCALDREIKNKELQLGKQQKAVIKWGGREESLSERMNRDTTLLRNFESELTSTMGKLQDNKSDFDIWLQTLNEPSTTPTSEQSSQQVVDETQCNSQDDDIDKDTILPPINIIAKKKNDKQKHERVVDQLSRLYLCQGLPNFSDCTAPVDPASRKRRGRREESAQENLFSKPETITSNQFSVLLKMREDRLSIEAEVRNIENQIQILKKKRSGLLALTRLATYGKTFGISSTGKIKAVISSLRESEKSLLPPI